MLMGNFAHFIYFSPQDIVDGYVHCLKRLFEFSTPQNYLSPLHIPQHNITSIHRLPILETYPRTHTQHKNYTKQNHGCQPVFSHKISCIYKVQVHNSIMFNNFIDLYSLYHNSVLHFHHPKKTPCTQFLPQPQATTNLLFISISHSILCLASFT